jgi:small GTP-binding protein
MSDETFSYDVFLSHSSQDKPIVRELAERLRSDGLKVWFDELEIKPGDSIFTKIEEGLEQSRVLVLFMSENSFGSDWVNLEANTFGFRDPLNKKRRFIPLRLDDSPIKGSLAQFLYLDWRPEARWKSYEKFLEAIHFSDVGSFAEKMQVIGKKKKHIAKKIPKREERAVWDSIFYQDGKYLIYSDVHKVTNSKLQLWNLEKMQLIQTFEDGGSPSRTVTLSSDQNYITSGSDDGILRLFDIHTGMCLLKLQGHSGCIYSSSLSFDNQLAISGADDHTLRLWNLKSGNCIHVLEGHSQVILDVEFSNDNFRALSCSFDKTIRLWDLETGTCIRTIEGHTDRVRSLNWSQDQRSVLSGSDDNTLRLWDVDSGRCLRIFEGHTAWVLRVVWSNDYRYALSGSCDKTMRLWDVESGQCLGVFEGHEANVEHVSWSKDQRHAFSCDNQGHIRIWDLQDYIGVYDSPNSSLETRELEQTQYSNAKVMLVGDTGVGKSGLWHRLTQNQFIPTVSTDGAWATQWKLQNTNTPNGVEREIWLWDFAGQADYRLMHQLAFDETALAVLVFDPQREDTINMIGQWNKALEQSSKTAYRKLLVAARVDRGGLRISDQQIETLRHEYAFKAFLKTSAQTGEGCDDLREAILEHIDWEARTTVSPRTWKLLKDEIIKLKDEGVVLIGLAELKQTLELRLSAERFDLDELRTVIRHLIAPGVVWLLNLGQDVLLQPERINQYASALVRSVRSHADEIGCILEKELLDGKLDYQQLERLPESQERTLLLDLNHVLLERGLCLRESTEQGVLLVFPSFFRRERPIPMDRPAAFVTYKFQAFLDEVYATLVVKLHHTTAFEKDQLWHYAADFKTQSGQYVGIKLTPKHESYGEITVYCDPKVPDDTKVLFIRYVNDHLKRFDENLERVRHYFCSHCGTSVENLTTVRKRLDAGQKDIICVDCEKRVLLQDLIEQKFASEKVRREVQEAEAEVQVKLSNESLERILVAYAMDAVARAGHLFIERTVHDKGIDGEIEFNDQNGEATGQRLYLQLKSGNSYLRTRERDQQDIFSIKKSRWAKYWQSQAYPVMLVVRTNNEVRWMDVSTYLKERSSAGETVKQIEFSGEVFNEFSVRRLAKQILATQ